MMSGGIRVQRSVLSISKEGGGEGRLVTYSGVNRGWDN